MVLPILFNILPPWQVIDLVTLTTVFVASVVEMTNFLPLNIIENLKTGKIDKFFESSVIEKNKHVAVLALEICFIKLAFIVEQDVEKKYF